MPNVLMYDAVNPEKLPKASVYAAYVNGAFVNHARVCALFPRARVFGIDVIGDAWDAASILDYEEGNACFNPAALRAWVTARENFRPHTACVYTDRQNLPGVEEALDGLWHTIWVSSLDGTVLTGTETDKGNKFVATQFKGGFKAPYDVSEALPEWVA